MKYELYRLLRAVLITLVLIVGSAYAQSIPVTADPVEHPTLKVTVAFSNLNVVNRNLPGVNLSADFKLADAGRWRLGAVIDGAYQRDTQGFGVTSFTDRFQFLGGAQVSYAPNNRINFFGRGLFGVTRFDSRGVKAPVDFNRGTVGFGGGLDVNLGEYFFVRPIQADFQFIDTRPARYTRFGAGGGFRF